MSKSLKKSDTASSVYLSIAGAGAGFVNGLLGTGGGIIIIYVLSKLNKNKDPKDNFASAIAAILPMSLVSAGFYLKQNSFDITQIYIYILPAIAGGILGAFLLCKIKTTVLQRIFAFVVIYAGITFII